MDLTEGQLNEGDGDGSTEARIYERIHEAIVEEQHQPERAR